MVMTAILLILVASPVHCKLHLTIIFAFIHYYSFTMD